MESRSGSLYIRGPNAFPKVVFLSKLIDPAVIVWKTTANKRERPCYCEVVLTN